MTVAAWAPNMCPKCRSTSGTDLGDGIRLCFDCRWEWDPATTTGPIVEPLTVVPDPVVVAPEATEAPGTSPGSPDPLAVIRSNYLGCEVVVNEFDAPGTISEVDDDGFVTVEFGSGYSVRCAPDEFVVTDAQVIADETIEALGTTYLTVAAQVLRAGAATIAGDGESRRLAVPPDGWLPDDPDVMPVIEAGAAYALAALALTAGIANDDILSMADMLDEAAGAAKGANNP